MSGSKQLVLIDGSGYIFRAFHALPPMTRGDGTPVNAVYGFTVMVMKLVDDLAPAHVAVVFDSARKTFRNDIYAEYKANRTDPPEELVPQFDLVREATTALSLPQLEVPGFEADDAHLGQLARRELAETRAGFLGEFRDEMHRHKARSPQEVVVRGMWLQSLADFEAGAMAGAPPALALATSASHSFGSMSPLEKKWHQRRQLWASLWEHERDWHDQQKGVSVNVCMYVQASEFRVAAGARVPSLFVFREG